MDTNVVSEAMRPEPNPRVLAWLNTQPTETLYLPSVALAELLFGIATLPDGHRKERLARALEGLMALFPGRVLPFDADAACHYADLALTARQTGRGLSTADGYIAASAACWGYEVASRDVSPYRAVGLTVIDPWATPPETS
ncbi:type II toxin-antitoxin system VapC family toxin [Thiocapsa rosea]|uniref:Ribonuclease VapC n=1 Tax=Thiocapsa rosea TaxID=69360 RepID=A0A495V991_9GAMM|nr:type II toxin-antitoxin system VapC family toxin [Thiocapsa rosea]RKT45972.1 hypothetical protein BDD21_3466 [Thiocapsa rosea]